MGHHTCVQARVVYTQQYFVGDLADDSVDDSADDSADDLVGDWADD